MLCTPKVDQLLYFKYDLKELSYITNTAQGNEVHTEGTPKCRNIGHSSAVKIQQKYYPNTTSILHSRKYTALYNVTKFIVCKRSSKFTCFCLIWKFVTKRKVKRGLKYFRPHPVCTPLNRESRGFIIDYFPHKRILFAGYYITHPFQLLPTLIKILEITLDS